MKSTIRFAISIGLSILSAAVSAAPIFAIGGSGQPGQSVFVTLKDASPTDLEAAMVLVQFDQTRLSYMSSVVGDAFPAGTELFPNTANLNIGRVTLVISSNTDPVSDSNERTLLRVTFDILQPDLNDDPVTIVSFRCVPVDPGEDVDAVTNGTQASALCPPDYIIPPTFADVTVLSPTAQAPIASTVSLALLGLGLMGWMRWRRPDTF